MRFWSDLVDAARQRPVGALKWALVPGALWHELIHVFAAEFFGAVEIEAELFRSNVWIAYDPDAPRVAALAGIAPTIVGAPLLGAWLIALALALDAGAVEAVGPQAVGVVYFITINLVVLAAPSPKDLFGTVGLYRRLG